ncbi:cation:proton antiporter [Pseudalkalibacillus berkeleyi]|uniref:Sodium:proton antiporter n=1 Tax=Pseudalkalibacillus berkeleyi TaxID=1069813 RepID=A0ABS9H5X0_9BACL|nr:sodium:proton antiporter [Pseudalkalibacillus berkeleyi]MCF6139060.1 sodium:proton antiporter [Pseudalkalibacillus berkeleyi]
MSVSQIIILLLIGYIVFTIDKKQKNFPVPVILLLIGIGLSFIPYFSNVDVTKEVLYDVFLPGLLFVSAYRFSPTALRKNAGIIASLSTLGLIVTTILLGGAIYWVSGWFVDLSFVGALVIAAILTPTDPVSVVSILKQSSNDSKVADVVDGESMINDGTSVVLYTVLVGIFIEDRSFSMISFLSEFLYTALGGAVLGLVIGWLFSKAVHITHHKDYQVMLSIIISYGVFHIAEHLGLSGVLATVAAGVMLSWEFKHTNKEDHYQEALDGFWGVVEPTILTLLFLLIGIVTTDHLDFQYWSLAVIVFVASLVVRFIVIFGTTQIFQGWRQQISWKTASLITWAGIRGTVSVVLVLSLQEKATKEMDILLSLSFAVVVLSLTIQSLGIYPLSRRLSTNKKEE